METGTQVNTHRWDTQHATRAMNIPMEGISIFHNPEVIHVQSASALTALSSAIVGGGFQRVRHILNAHVDKDYSSPNPKANLRAIARSMDIREPFIGLLTAVKLSKARLACLQANGLSVGALVTAGVSNAACAGVTPPYSYSPGTINVVLILDANLTRAAMLNAVITATEAKCAVLQEMGIRTADGDRATGTSTDTVTVAVTGRGDMQSYAGPVTTPGWLIARAVRQSLQESLEAE
ncbi:MAG: adenosylcobinamide amidohydrolase [Chloroflexi bacterium]|nr:adenosylcobinamide amidohydrolase [Chloroflexota bacterium]